LVVFHVITGMVGTAELAASNVIVNLMLVGVLPAMGFGLAAMSLVGQTLGAGNIEDARRWGWEVGRISIVVVTLIAIPGMAVPEFILGFFLQDPQTLALAENPLRLVSIGMAVDALGMVLMNCLMGAGDNRRVMVVSIALQWMLFLPAAYLVGPVLGLGLLAIYAASVGHRALQSLMLALLWRGDGWIALRL
jgi:Na+-driven multidrug efflux pump